MLCLLFSNEAAGFSSAPASSFSKKNHKIQIRKTNRPHPTRLQAKEDQVEDSTVPYTAAQAQAILNEAFQNEAPSSTITAVMQEEDEAPLEELVPGIRFEASSPQTKDLFARIKKTQSEALSPPTSPIQTGNEELPTEKDIASNSDLYDSAWLNTIKTPAPVEEVEAPEPTPGVKIKKIGTLELAVLGLEEEEAVWLKQIKLPGSGAELRVPEAEPVPAPAAEYLQMGKDRALKQDDVDEVTLGLINTALQGVDSESTIKLAQEEPENTQDLSTHVKSKECWASGISNMMAQLGEEDPLELFKMYGELMSEINPEAFLELEQMLQSGADVAETVEYVKSQMEKVLKNIKVALQDSDVLKEMQVAVQNDPALADNPFFKTPEVQALLKLDAPTDPVATSESLVEEEAVEELTLAADADVPAVTQDAVTEDIEEPVAVASLENEATISKNNNVIKKAEVIKSEEALGIVFMDINGNVIISELLKNAPQTVKAQLQQGDKVISINSINYNTGDEMAAAIRELEVGASINFEVERSEGSIKTFSVTKPKDQLGLLFETVEEGKIIVGYIQDYCLEEIKRNIQVGDQILSINGVTYSTDISMAKAIRQLNVGDKITFEIKSEAPLSTQESFPTLKTGLGVDGSSSKVEITKPQGVLGVRFATFEGTVKVNAISAAAAQEIKGKLSLGDEILAVNGVEYSEDLELAAAIRAIPVGNTINLSVRRSFEADQMEAESAAEDQVVEAEEQVAEQIAEQVTEQIVEPNLVVELQKSKDRIGLTFDMVDKNIIIQKIEEHALSEVKDNLKVGDQILKMNSNSYSLDTDLVVALRSLSVGSTIQFEIIRQMETELVAEIEVKMEEAAAVEAETESVEEISVPEVEAVAVAAEPTAEITASDIEAIAKDEVELAPEVIEEIFAPEIKAVAEPDEIVAPEYIEDVAVPDTESEATKSHLQEPEHTYTAAEVQLLLNEVLKQVEAPSTEAPSDLQESEATIDQVQQSQLFFSAAEVQLLLNEALEQVEHSSSETTPAFQEETNATLKLQIEEAKKYAAAKEAKSQVQTAVAEPSLASIGESELTFTAAEVQFLLNEALKQVEEASLQDMEDITITIEKTKERVGLRFATRKGIMEIDYISKDAILAVVNQLKVGDEVVSMNGVKYQVPAELADAIKGIEVGDDMVFSLRRKKDKDIQDVVIQKTKEKVGLHFTTFKGTVKVDYISNDAVPGVLSKLKVGDEVLSLNGKNYHIPAYLADAIKEIKVGDEIALSIRRKEEPPAPKSDHPILLRPSALRK